MQLVVVESPNKVKKIRSLLGPGYEVVATVGHFCDLPRRELGIDLASMEPTYETARGKTDVVKRLKAAAKGADSIILATDPDREGEAIAWHVARVLGAKGRQAKRARFHEITKDAVQRAVRSAGGLDLHLVDAQQSRRVLDRLCGYQVSPLLWAFGKGLSAGRVQSATLHIVVEREKARRAFKVKTYWEVLAQYRGGVEAWLIRRDEKGKAARLQCDDEAAAKLLVEQLRGVPHVVHAVQSKEAFQKPRPPFVTSSLQQVASSVLKLSPAQSMQRAQELFEAGLITYHRTDSLNISDEAVAMAREYIANVAPGALPPQAPKYKSKGGSQEAHEAIRPTTLEPDLDSLDEVGKKLWRLIRDRFLASQCKPAKLLQQQALIRAGEHELLAKATQILDPGYRRFLAFDETQDKGPDSQAKATSLDLSKGQNLDVADVLSKKGQTQPPPRFTEATLVREMERLGIGRPSTYAATVKLLLARSYVGLEKRNLYPTELGERVDGLLEKGFSDLLEPRFTADMEGQLDQVAAGTLRWKSICQSYQAGLSAQIERAKPLFDKLVGNQPDARPAPQPTGKLCPQCQKELLLRHGTKGAFLGCSGYPKCKYTVDPDAVGKPMETMPCLLCDGVMEKRKSNKGEYWKCQKCSKTADVYGLAKAKGATCPDCHAPMVVRKGRKGEFLGCLRYPDCKIIQDFA